MSFQLGAEEWQEILDSAHNGVIAVNREGMIIVFNKAASELVGVLQDEAIGRRVDEVIPSTRLFEVMNCGNPENGQRMVIGERTVISNRSPIWRRGEIIGAVGVFQDISDYDALSLQLDVVKNANKDLDAVIESVDDGIVVADDQGYILRANQAYLRMAGIAHDEFVGKHVQELFKQGYLNRSVSQLVIERRSRVNLVDVRNGKELLMTGIPVFDEDGELLRVVTAVRDITELSSLKAKLAESEQVRNRYLNELELLRAKHPSHGIITQNPELQTKIETAFHVAKVDSTVLILGESGVGKELIAELIHRASRRGKGPFIKINCGAIPANLLESEFFGYEPGAFTGASKDGKPGLFELAQGGTLFLDEVGELPLDLQVKVLRALQGREIIRIGGKKSIALDVRYLAATNRDLEEMVRNKVFREDLYYRLNVVPIVVPPLRRRKEDIVPLTNEFMQRFNQRYGLQKWLSPQAIQALLTYDWPGNVRELENTMERLVVTSREDEITAAGLSEIAPAIAFASQHSIEEGDAFSLEGHLAREEKRLLREAYRKAGSTRKAAALLKISQSAMVKKMQKYGVKG